MSNNTFEVSVLNVPSKNLVGNWMALNAAADQEDYAALWQVFFNRLNKVPELSPEISYGICANLKENLDCHYWTAIETRPGLPVPRGMVSITVGDGPYACLSGSRRITLDEAYDYLCNQWEKSQSAFVVDRQAPCFEEHGRDKGSSGGFRKLCVPLKVRGAADQDRLDLSSMVATAA